MNRTTPSYQIILEKEIEKWKGFKNALRRDERKVFETLMKTSEIMLQLQVLLTDY